MEIIEIENVSIVADKITAVGIGQIKGLYKFGAYEWHPAVMVHLVGGEVLQIRTAEPDVTRTKILEAMKQQA